MIKIKNIENGEMMQVWQTSIDKASGRIYCNGTPTSKYLAKYPLTSTGETCGEKDTFLAVSAYAGRRLRKIFLNVTRTDTDMCPNQKSRQIFSSATG